eukprot:TRINITY_DN9255_c0_g1_i2.p1 TRINITY_DN9255_c0_g1~~TRINITY_DN9255_c0_g1_i2.p1  ORF type:complete len:619 (+),score=135.11 TRINITY_DN9255_c0_g1_i2:115-1971(+)
MNFQEGNSDAYWGAESWDPDGRVYVGASVGQTFHQRAVEPDKDPYLVNAAVPSSAGKVSESSAAKESQCPKTGIADGGGSVDYWDQACGAPAASAPVGLGGLPGASASGKTTSEAQTALSAGAGYSGGAGAGPGMSMQSDGSSDYWDDYGKPPTQHGSARLTAKLDDDSTAHDSTTNGGKQEMTYKRTNSDAYWDADQWDPDNRIYVGAEAGQNHHLQAVDPLNTADQELWRIWAGGLTSVGLDLGSPGAVMIDLKAAGQNHTLKDVYEIHDESVGSGSFGVVRTSQHKSSGTKCVIKSVSKIAAGERYRSNLVDRGLGETLLRMSKELRHPNIALYLDLMEGPKNFYVIMEELKGAELMEQVEEMFPLMESYVQRVMKQILQALAHIHNKVLLVHRDVKLSNFRFRSSAADADLALLDFGFASSLNDKWDGAVCGTPMFMAPEVVGSFAASPHLAAIDIWAAGVILYVLLTGDSPAQEDGVRLLGCKGKEEEAKAIMEKALAAPELSSASAETRDLLGQLLLLEPSSRLTAVRALEHAWFSTEGTDRKLAVSEVSKYKFVRSASKMSINSSVSSMNSRRKGKGKGKAKTSDNTLGLPTPKFNQLERIVSEGVEELKP